MYYTKSRELQQPGGTWYPTSEAVAFTNSSSFQSKFIYYPSPERFPLSWCTVRTVLAWPIHDHWKLTWCLSSPHSSMYTHSPDLVLVRLGEPSQPYRTFLVPGSILSAAVISLGVSDKLRTKVYFFVIYAMESPINAPKTIARSRQEWYFCWSFLVNWNRLTWRW